MASEVVSLAERLRQRRLELGLSQAQAARELDVARTAYRLWEMDSAKPAPDRWRLLSRWLGMSVTALLLAEDLLSEEEAAQNDLTDGEFGRLGQTWDVAAEAKAGSFFEQSRALAAEAVGSGQLTTEQADELRVVLERIEREREDLTTRGWQPATLMKLLRADRYAASAGREALAFLAGGLPAEPLGIAQLVATELVNNSVVHGPDTAAPTVGLSIDVGREVVRVEVTDSAAGQPRLKPPSAAGGYGLTIVDSLADRWGTSREGDENVTWFELDLPQPGSRGVGAA